jgi:hypothetical protein
MRQSFPYAVALAAVVAAPPLGAQSMSPEEILAEVEARVSAQNPYAALLNDPDPARSLAAMQVMLESGDADLIRMATEFGLLSPNPSVQRSAVQGILATGPSLTVRLEGGNEEAFRFLVMNQLGGVIDDEATGFVTLPVGDWDAAQSCYLWRGSTSCLIQVSAEGYAVRSWYSNHMRGMLRVDGEGRLAGSMTMEGVTALVPASIRLID